MNVCRLFHSAVGVMCNWRVY